MDLMHLFIFGIASIASGGLLTLVIPEKFKGWVLAVFVLCGTALVAYVSACVLACGSPLYYKFVMHLPGGESSMLIDRLAAFFIIIISVTGFLGVFYAIGYLKSYVGKGYGLTSHYFFISMLLASMITVAAVHNFVLFLVSWEIMSLSSFFLVSFENYREDVYRAALNYIVAMHVGVLFLMGGFLYASSASASYDFSAFSEVFSNGKASADIFFILLFIGFGTKAGFIPFHTWLPKAHPAAPSHVSGLMSWVMIKTGIYGILRTLTLIKTPGIEISYMVLVISLLTAVFGILYAIAQKNIKTVLAYSSVENIGIIGAGIAVGILGLTYNIDP
jgi:formate hydrogenlyase subunit 3/multisubunit Na+/H+ antiporter MnhD subunit